MDSGTRVVGLGAGGHAKVVIDALRQSRRGDVVALVDSDPALWGGNVLGVPIVGGDERLLELRESGVTAFFVGAGMIDAESPRARLYALGLSAGLTPIATVHPSAIVSPHAELGPGVTILAGAILNAGARLGANVIVNSGAIVEHDCTIGDHAHVATGARLSGGVTVGHGAHIGVGACVRQGITIESRAVVGAGAAVVGSVAAGSTVAGVPARELRSKQ